MRFGVFYQHQLPRPWKPGQEAQLFRDTLDQVELADRLGIDCVWVAEHHFLEEYGHSSAPEVFLAACSQRTTRIRLGHGIVQLPPAFNHAVRVAERAATLDVLSGGRVELGTGEASSEIELGGFGVDRDTKRAQWEEALDVLARLFVEEPFAGHQGTHLDLPPRKLVPKPTQRPHPPLWVACSRRETIHLAANKGTGALSFAFVDAAEAKARVDDYYATLQSSACVAAGFSVNPNVAIVTPMMCHADEEEALRRGLAGAQFFGFSLAHYYLTGTHRPGATDLWHRFQGDGALDGGGEGEGRLGVELLEQGLGPLRGCVGTPQQVRSVLRTYEDAGVDQVIFVCQSGHNRHEHICESLELFAREVLPEFAERADELETRKHERLATAMAAALARRPEPRAADPTYEVPAGASV